MIVGIAVDTRCVKMANGMGEEDLCLVTEWLIEALFLISQCVFESNKYST